MVFTFGVAVLVGLHDLAVHAEGDVVDEHPVGHDAEVDALLDAVDERVERTDDVVPIDPEVEREVVAGPGRDADEREIVLHRDGRHERLRPVAPRRAQHGRARLDRVDRLLAPVVLGPQDDRLHPTLAALLDDVELLDLAAAGLRVHQQDRPLGRAGPPLLDLAPTDPLDLRPDRDTAPGTRPPRPAPRRSRGRSARPGSRARSRIRSPPRRRRPRRRSGPAPAGVRDA